MDNLRGLQGIRSMDRISNALIRELCGVRKCLDERTQQKSITTKKALKRLSKK